MPSPGAVGVRLDTLQTRRILGGLSVSDLARLSNTTDWLITQLEAGGNCDGDVATRILNALASPVALATNTQASPTVFTVTAGTTFRPATR
jgi:hypothetical protein